MFYKQFLEITNELNPEFVEKFDYWLTTLPINNKKNITSSVISTRLGVSHSQAELILKFAEKKNILEKYYFVCCPDCNHVICKIEEADLLTILIDGDYCIECEHDKKFSPDDIYIAYKVILLPDITEYELNEAIQNKIGEANNNKSNFSKADLLVNNNDLMYKIYYSTDKSAYEELKKLRLLIDENYEDTVSKGKVLENLVLKIFNRIKFVCGSQKIRTVTNQFDCTALCNLDTSYPSVFNYLSPYFIIECKNEPQKTPGNTYLNKILGIMQHNDAKIGIIFSRKPAAKTCWTIAREQYLTTKNLNKVIIILCMDDTDLDYIINDEVNLLSYLSFKIMQLTANAPNAKWSEFNNN